VEPTEPRRRTTVVTTISLVVPTTALFNFHLKARGTWVNVPATLDHMKLTVVIVLLATTASLTHADPEPALKEKKERISYALGAYIGEYWKHQGLKPDDVDWSLVVKGFHAQIFDRPLLMNNTDIREAIRTLSSALLARHYQHQHDLAVNNRKLSDTFLAANKAKPGVVTLPSGLQYKILTPGSGTSPTSNDLVVVNYRITTIEGTEIDNSTTHKPAQVPVPISGTKGWVEALQLMKPGAKWELVVPPELAHGERGSFPLIPPNATLLYEVALVSFQPGPKKQEPASVPIQGAPSDIIKIPSTQDLNKGAQIEIMKPDRIYPPETGPKP
jgi:FKBP-type peptidyl-prolyl cis-trans isomerase FklB